MISLPTTFPNQPISFTLTASLSHSPPPPPHPHPIRSATPSLLFSPFPLSPSYQPFQVFSSPSPPLFSLPSPPSSALSPLNVSQPFVLPKRGTLQMSWAPYKSDKMPLFGVSNRSLYLSSFFLLLRRFLRRFSCFRLLLFLKLDFGPNLSQCRPCWRIHSFVLFPAHYALPEFFPRPHMNRLVNLFESLFSFFCRFLFFLLGLLLFLAFFVYRKGDWGIRIGLREVRVLERTRARAINRFMDLEADGLETFDSWTHDYWFSRLCELRILGAWVVTGRLDNCRLKCSSVKMVVRLCCIVSYYILRLSVRWYDLSSSNVSYAVRKEEEEAWEWRNMLPNNVSPIWRICETPGH